MYKQLEDQVIKINKQLQQQQQQLLLQQQQRQDYMI